MLLTQNHTPAPVVLPTAVQRAVQAGMPRYDDIWGDDVYEVLHQAMTALEHGIRRAEADIQSGSRRGRALGAIARSQGMAWAARLDAATGAAWREGLRRLDGYYGQRVALEMMQRATRALLCDELVDDDDACETDPDLELVLEDEEESETW